TDRVGKDADNDRLSLQRAERVRQSLVAQGIAAERIRASGRGERELVTPTADGVDEPRNRRVEINVR
ncbi:MAG TPA: OmpA family protein, partial [Burkholderiales bacterium]|nr:OmpA family protein [Burkholderiales bacterium]